MVIADIVRPRTKLELAKNAALLTTRDSVTSRMFVDEKQFLVLSIWYLAKPLRCR
jgi:hypothetical protein